MSPAPDALIEAAAILWPVPRSPPIPVAASDVLPMALPATDVVPRPVELSAAVVAPPVLPTPSGSVPSGANPNTLERPDDYEAVATLTAHTADRARTTAAAAATVSSRTASSAV